MLYEILKTVHVLSIILWVGGMMFAHWFLRPALHCLEGPDRLRLMQDVLLRFFRAVFVASLLILVTGYWMLGRVARLASQSETAFVMPVAWWVMAILGTLMVAIFMHIRFALFRRLRDAVQFSQWSKAAQALGSIRVWVGVNLFLGVAIVLVTLLLA